ncbi:unknown [Methanothermobacter thermautotrophicus str. Delta H]|uniref:Uncharacterized protein n=1 Tax=Methanothermobacter thermautotrophicus (strain ATCC 29096 / DSM 1053 / JCM 10044 / NBRC 100330 / Delta H) TaxID=187420 RepID=O27803_METTH|nr:unknown [Methanothermobacter thermautotrophicus str. Delta H]
MEVKSFRGRFHHRTPTQRGTGAPAWKTFKAEVSIDRVLLFFQIFCNERYQSPARKPPIAPPIPMKSIDTIRRASTSTPPAKAPIRKPTGPARAVPKIVSKMATNMPPNAPATVAFQKPPLAPSFTMRPTTKPARNNPRIEACPIKGLRMYGKTIESINPRITAPHLTIVNTITVYVSES